MTRLGARLAWEHGVAVLLTLHDQIFAEAAFEDRFRVAALLEECMVEASRIILDGFALRVDTKIIAYGERYSDPRGDGMWRTLMALLNAIEREKAA